MDTPKLVVHGFQTSNNIKVRIALGYKGLDYEFRTIDPAQRDEIVRLSGQHLTPVLQHGPTVLFDSAAILRYLDANFPDTPRLFGTSREQQWEIEDWELFARTQLASPMMQVVHRRVRGEEVDARTEARCAADFAAAVAKLAERLAGREWLVGDALSVADITSAAVLYRIESSGMFAYPPEGAALAEWRDRVMAYDRG